MKAELLNACVKWLTDKHDDLPMFSLDDSNCCALGWIARRCDYLDMPMKYTDFAINGIEYGWRTAAMMTFDLTGDQANDLFGPPYYTDSHPSKYDADFPGDAEFDEDGDFDLFLWRWDHFVKEYGNDQGSV